MNTNDWIAHATPSPLRPSRLRHRLRDDDCPADHCVSENWKGAGMVTHLSTDTSVLREKIRTHLVQKCLASGDGSYIHHNATEVIDAVLSVIPGEAGCGTPGCSDPDCQYGKQDDAALAAARSPDVAATPSSGHNEPEGYAAFLRQQAEWVDESREGKVSVYQRITMDDIDTDEMRAAADFIDRQARGPSQASQDEMENYRLALAWIKGQSTDPQAKEIAATALDAYSVSSTNRGGDQ